MSDPVTLMPPVSLAPTIDLASQPTTVIDAGLVSRAQKGDRTAFAEIFQLSVRSVTRYVGAILRDTTRTEDVVAQTYLEAWRLLPRLREADRFSAWILRIAHNRAIDELRRPEADPIEEAHGLSAPADAEPEEALLRQADVDKVRAALLQLPTDHREVVTLRFMQGMSHSEVARQMGRTEEASRALLHRAMLRLRRLLDED